MCSIFVLMPFYCFLCDSCLHLDLNCLKQQQLSIYDDVIAILSAMVLVGGEAENELANRII